MMQRAVQVPSALISTILGLVVLFVVGSSLLSRRWSIRRAALAAGKEAAPKEEAAKEAAAGEAGA
jgi:hypothetical protein